MIAWLLASGCSGGGTVEVPVPEPVPAGFPAPLRRINGEQFNRTVRDLFPGVTLPWVVFAPEERVGAFDNQASAQVPSTLLVEQLQSAAVEVTAAAMEAPETFLPCADDGGTDPSGCAATFLVDFGSRAFRRPLTPAESDLYLNFFDDQWADTGDFRVSIQLGMQAVLNSPDFLYLLEFGVPVPTAEASRVPLSGYEVASRLSYFLWGTMPDEALLEAAAAGDLNTADGVAAQAERMLLDERARDAVLDFHKLWLDLEDIDWVWLWYDTYPTWTEAMNPSLRAEIEAHVLDVWEGEGTLSALLLQRETSVDEQLSIAYGLPMGETTLPEETRAGVLTRAGWLAAKAHMINPSPVKRGVWVLDRLLCIPPASPPANVDTSLDAILGGPVDTNRQAYEAHVADPTCAGCHASIDGIGFGFENYDSMGTYRTLDNGLPVDATGSITLDGEVHDFDGAVALSELLASTEDPANCYALQWYRYALGRTEVIEDGPTVEAVRAAFLASGGDLRTAMIEIVRSDAFRTRP